MIWKYLLPLAAILGVVLAVFSVRASEKTTPATQPVAQPPAAPFANYIAGAGLIEASTENIAIGTVAPGVVDQVDVAVGQKVKAGDPLFAIEDRELRAQLAVEQAAVNAAKAQLEKLQASPRKEDLPPLEARVQSARAALANRDRELARVQRTGDAASQDEMDRAKFQVDVGKADVAAAQAELARTQAGAWGPDVEIARAAIASAEARRDGVLVEIDRRVIRAPVDGTVLRVEVRVGEYASVGFLATPLVLLGNIQTLHVRVDVDENDAWRVHENAPAEAAVRGNGRLKTPLRFVRIEPYVLPKRSLTGDSSERVDTRVLQVIYAFDAATFEKVNGTKVYPGQQLDVFIEGPSATAP